MFGPLDTGRSSTHMLSNAVVLSPLNLEKDLGRIQAHDIPIAYLPVFVHEVTHHWCFNSPVGLALFLLYCRARRAVLAHAESADEESEWDAIDAVVRYEMAQQIMLPLAEGLALFAEHDAVPGEATTISEPMLTASAVFARGLAIRSGTSFAKMRRLLAAARLSNAHIRRKADLLLHSLGCGEGGYLPGYLTVKHLWRMNFLACDRFIDTDFFLQFARAYIYEDWGLVHALLDDTKKDIGALDAIAMRLHRRLAEFAQCEGRDAAARRFEELCVENRYEKLELKSDLAHIEIPTAPPDPPANSEEGRAALQRAFAALFGRWPDDRRQQGAIHADLVELSTRRMITLGYLRAQAAVRDAELGVTLPDGQRFTIKRAPAMTDDWQGEVELEVVLAARASGMFLVVSHDGRLIDRHAFFEVNPEREPFGDLFDHIDDRVEHARLTGEAIDALLRRGTAKILRDHVRRATRRMTEGLYLPFALPGLSQRKRRVLKAQMKPFGMLPLLDNDLRLVADAAALSLCAPLDYAPRQIDMVRGWTAPDPMAAAARVNDRLAGVLGFAPLGILDGVLLTSMI